jgi:multidrug resistance efflux pump
MSRLTSLCGPRIALPFLALLAALAPVACDRTDPPAARADTPAAERGNAQRAEPPAVAVRVEPIRRGPISYCLTTTGDLAAEEWTDLVVRRAGIVEELLVEEGMPVKADDRLLVLDRREVEILLEQARTEEQEAAKRAELSRIAETEADNAVEQARIAAEKATSEYERYRRLSGGVVRQEELETRAYEMRLAKLALEAAENARSQARVNAAIAETVAANAVLKRKKAQIDLDFTVLTAPFAGVISARHVQRGQFLAANTRAYTLVNTSDLKLEVHLPQRYLPLLRPGLGVSLQSEAFGSEVFPARLERVSPVVGEKGTVKVTIRMQQRDLRLRPGMYVSAEIVIDTHEDALLASKRGVQYTTLGEAPHVFAVREGRAVKLPVRIGYRRENTLEVIGIPVPTDVAPALAEIPLGGGTLFLPADFRTLTEADRVVVAGQDRLRGGEAVTVVAEATEGAASPADPEELDRREPSPAPRPTSSSRSRTSGARQP